MQTLCTSNLLDFSKESLTLSQDSMVPIPLKLRKELVSDIEYQGCMLRSVEGHVCGGRPNTWEHAIMFKGSRLQKRWAIISICAMAHEVDQFQDAGTMSKERNVWVAVNRATDSELREISKVTDYIRMRRMLNDKYGIWMKPEEQFVNI
jgi:hypothetical protein